MSESESETAGIDNEQLPEDLQPGEENPLAEPLDDDVGEDELDVLDGEHAEESGDDDASDSEDDGASDDDA